MWKYANYVMHCKDEFRETHIDYPKNLQNRLPAI